MRSGKLLGERLQHRQRRPQRLALLRESIVGLTLSISATSPRPMGPSRTIVNRIEVWVGVSSEPALVGRRRRASLPITARSRAVWSVST